MESKRIDLKRGELTDRIIGIFYDVYNELSYGFLESVYEESLLIALRDAGLTVDHQVPVPVWFPITESVTFAPIYLSKAAPCWN
jgi:GxxExxY protein